MLETFYIKGILGMEHTTDDKDITFATNSFIKKLYAKGYWQVLMFFLIEQSVFYTGVFIAFSGTFTAANMDYTCDISSNTSIHGLVHEKCRVWNSTSNRSEDCNHGYRFYSDPNFVQSSIKADFQLVCDRKYLDGVSQSCIMAGFFIGGLLGPVIADKIGRRFITFIGLTVAGSTGILIGFANNIYLVMGGNVILGVMREATMSAGLVYGLEFIPNNKQSVFGMVTQLLWCLNISCHGMIAYFIRDWRYLQIFGALPILLSGLFVFIVPESPRWLIVNGKFGQLEKLVKNYANKINKSDLDTSEVIVLNNVYEKYDDFSSSQKKKCKYGPMDILRSKVLCLWSIILILGWIFLVMSYYGLTMLSVNFHRNKYVSFILTSFLEAPCILLTFFTIRRGRNITLLILSAITALSFVTLGFLDRKYSVLILLLSVVGKGALSSMFYVIVVTSIYIYPTTIRSFGTRFPSAVAKLFAVSIPYFVKLYNVYSWLPTLIIGVFACFIGSINILFPDWINMPLPETIEDLRLLKSSIGLHLKGNK